MKTIGVLGGIGPQATMDFEMRFHQVAQQLIPQQSNTGYPPMVVYYFRQTPVVMPADGSMPTSQPPVHPQLLDAARRLGGWADFLVIMANGIHHYQDEIEQAAGKKVLSMVDAVAAEVRRRQAKKVGIVDFRPAQFGVYASCLDRNGVAWEATPAELLQPMAQAVFAVDEGQTGAELGRPARSAIQALRARGVDALILACTEIPFLTPESLTDPEVINPVQLLAEAAVRYAMA